MKSVSIKNLSFAYHKDYPVIKNLSLDIESGDYVSIVGHNGCGKSTLARLLVGLLIPKEGTISICDQELSDQTLSDIRKKIAIVFQNPDNQFIGATVEDDIAFSLENMCVPREEMVSLVKEYASKVGMENYLSKEPGYLSGGQKQRVAIADALVRNPEILILDEATSMLDPSGKQDILNLVNKMREENPRLTVISITHDIDEAYLSNRIVLMHSGEVILNCTPNELFDNAEVIKKYNLDLPFQVKLKTAVKELGIDAKNTDSLDDIGEKICKSR